jgi:F0F1-type ATP synthase membrane subunit b/b'
MAKNNNKKNGNGVVELWGHEFQKTAEGLDKSEVVSFVTELMKKNESLLKRADHLESLTKLAEKTIVEADGVARQIQDEARGKAKDEAKAILAEAEEQGQKIIEEKKAEAQARANREAEDIKAKAQQQAEKLLEEKIKEIQPELKNNAKTLYEELLTQLESLKKQVVTLEEELDHKLSEPPAKTLKATLETNKTDEVKKADNEFLELLQPVEEHSEAEPEWELEILPPIDLTQILDIINHLDDLPQVVRTELIPHMDKPTIMVFLRQPLELIEILETLPQVASVTEDKNGAEGKTRRAQIELPRQTVPQQSS